ncbi:MAG: hypothetical protein C4316_13300 [Chloroflexota bacterium]
MPQQSEVDRIIGQVIARAVAASKYVSVQLRLGPKAEEQVAGYRCLGVGLVSGSLLDFVRQHAPAFLEAVQRAAP